MPEPISITAQTLPEGTCMPGSMQELLNLIASNLLGALTDTVTLFNFGPNTPTVDRQDQPWIRVDATGKFLGIYTFTDGSWQPGDPPFQTGDVMPVALASQVIAAPWYAMNGQVVNGITVPDWRGRTVIGAGQRILPNGSTDTATVFNIGDTGGEEKHLLVVAEMPSHIHPPLSPATAYITANPGGGAQTAGGSGVGGQNTTGAAGSDTPHNTLPPYAAAQWKMYISAEDAGLT